MLESADTRADINRPSGRFGFTRVSALSVSKLRHTALASHKTLVTPETPTGWGSRYHFAATRSTTALISHSNLTIKQSEQSNNSPPRLVRLKASVTVVKPSNPRSYNCRRDSPLFHSHPTPPPPSPTKRIPSAKTSPQARQATPRSTPSHSIVPFATPSRTVPGRQRV